MTHRSKRARIAALLSGAIVVLALSPVAAQDKRIAELTSAIEKMRGGN